MPSRSESEVERLLAIPTPPLSPVSPTSYPLLPFLMPLPIFTPLPTSSFLLPSSIPSTSGSESIPEADIPLQKRVRFTTPTSRYEIGESGSSIAATAARQIRPTLTIADKSRADDKLIGRLRRERQYFRTLATTYAKDDAHSRDYCTRIMDYCQSREVHTKTLVTQIEALQRDVNTLQRQHIKHAQRDVAPEDSDSLPSHESDNSVPKNPENDRGYVAFGGNPKGGKITSKGKIRTGKLDFDDVYFVKELKFNLFSLPQMCDKKNSVLFTDTECVVLSSDFKLPNENHVLLRVPRENNMYNVDLKNIVPSGDLTCLFAKATLDKNPKGGKITSKGKIRTGKLDFDDVYFVKEVKFNLFSLPRMCDKKNSVLFTDTEFVVLSSDFKLPNENHVLLRVPRENNMYNVDLKNIVSSGDLTCLFAKATLDEVLVTKPHNKTPYELLLGRTPSIGFMRPFGYPVTILNTLDPLGKFDGKANEGFLVGYSVSSKDFRVFNIRTRIVQETLHINFLENKPNVAGSGPTWLLDTDTLTQSMNYQPVVTGNQPNSSVGIQENLTASTGGKEAESIQKYMLLLLWSSGSNNPQNTDAAAFEVKEPESKVHVSPNSSDKTKKHDEKTKREAKGKSLVDLVNAATTPVTAVKPNSTNITNNFNTIGPSNTAISLTFEIGGKSLFVDPSQYPNDTDMHALEDITYLDDEEDVDTVAEFSNLEINITISPIPITRVHKDHLVTQIIGDLSSAPQTKSMARMVKEQGGLTQINDEDFHTCMFACFLSQEEPKRVHQALKDPSWIEAMQEELLQFKMQKEEGIDYKEIFAPVARIEDIRLFLAYASFMGFMVYPIDVKSAFLCGTIEEEVYVCQPLGFKDLDYPDKNGFQRGKIDQTLFIKKQKGDILLVQMSSMGELTLFLGLQVKQNPDGIFIRQDKYVVEILRKFGLTDEKSASTLINTKKPLLKDPDGKDVDVHTYRSLISSSRPDIMFSICACAHFQVTPKASNLHAVKRIFRYLKGKPHLGLWYPKDSPFNLVAYSDSDYAGASLGVNTPSGDVDSLGIMELMVFFVPNYDKDRIEVFAVDLNVSAVKQIFNAVSSKLLLFGLPIDAAHLMLLGHKVNVVGSQTTQTAQTNFHHAIPPPLDLKIHPLDSPHQPLSATHVLDQITKFP
nr:hypothetical protein [Tanacetum cinerariifolium]